ncbi:MAG: zinc-ribbon domain-containing protein [Thermomicrobiales bacterium]
MNSFVAPCGRCGAPNSEDAEFCQSCGALLAAYRAPTGATETPIVAPPAEAIQPPPARVRESLHQSAADLEAPSTPPTNGSAAPVEVDQLLVEDGSPVEELVPSEPVSESSAMTQPVLSAWHEAAVTSQAATATRPAEAALEAVPKSLSTPSSTDPLPIPKSFRALSGRNIPDSRSPLASNRRSTTARKNSAPHLLIAAGVSAFFLAFIIGVTAGSTISIVLLFLGGPLGFGLIMAGILMLVGRHPTGRP